MRSRANIIYFPLTTARRLRVSFFVFFGTRKILGTHAYVDSCSIPADFNAPLRCCCGCCGCCSVLLICIGPYRGHTSVAPLEFGLLAVVHQVSISYNTHTVHAPWVGMLAVRLVPYVLPPKGNLVRSISLFVCDMDTFSTFFVFVEDCATLVST